MVGAVALPSAGSLSRVVVPSMVSLRYTDERSPSPLRIEFRRPESDAISTNPASDWKATYRPPAATAACVLGPFAGRPPVPTDVRVSEVSPGPVLAGPVLAGLVVAVVGRTVAGWLAALAGVTASTTPVVSPVSRAEATATTSRVFMPG